MGVTEGYVKTEIHQKVGTIEFHHPQSNSLPAAVLVDLAKAINQAAHDPEIQCNRFKEYW